MIQFSIQARMEDLIVFELQEADDPLSIDSLELDIDESKIDQNRENQIVEAKNDDEKECDQNLFDATIESRSKNSINIDSDPLLKIPSPEDFNDKSSSSSPECAQNVVSNEHAEIVEKFDIIKNKTEKSENYGDELIEFSLNDNVHKSQNQNQKQNQDLENDALIDLSNVKPSSNNEDNEDENENETEPLIDFTEIPISNIQKVEEEKGPPPQWITVTLSFFTKLLALQPSIAIHRSKLFSLYDSFRALQKNFQPDLSLNNLILKANCFSLIEAVNKTRQIVYSCSASHWGQSAITWPACTVKDSVRRLRMDINDCLKSFRCKDPPNFIISEEELEAQDKVDILQLKGSLIEYLNRISEQQKTNQIIQITEMIKERLKSIGPVDGLQEGPALLHITPFLPPSLNLVLTNDDFELGETIGSGTFGSVYKGVIKATGQKVAIKKLNASFLGGRQLETFKREVWTMATINHPSILHLIGVTLSAPFCIVTELLKCSLYDRLKYLSPTKRSVIALRVSQAMEQLHSARIIHRDLKSANILLDENDLPRVCDFGLVGFKIRGTRTGYVGTAQWMAPEILKSSPFYDEKVDVYSFAILLWEMLTQRQPYKDMTQDQMVLAIIEHGLRPEIKPEYGPPKLIELITKCWSEKPSDRPSFPQITNTLFLPECHFYGTNEEEFQQFTPHQVLSTNIVHAYDCCDWKKFDRLLSEITPEKCKTDTELINIVIGLIPNLNINRQVNIIKKLPYMVDIQQFLCLKGYSFILSLFSLDTPVINATAEMLRSIPLSSKGFRQVRLISTLTTTPNENTLQLCADLCEFEDIARHVAEHDIPFSISGFELSLIKIYKNLLRFPNLRATVSKLSQPLTLSAIAVHDDPIEVCECLCNFEFAMSQSKLIIDLGLIPMIAEFVDQTPLAIQILSNVFAICSREELAEFKDIIDDLLSKYKDYFIHNSTYLKLSSLSNIEEEFIDSFLDE